MARRRQHRSVGVVAVAFARHASKATRFHSALAHHRETLATEWKTRKRGNDLAFMQLPGGLLAMPRGRN